MVKNIYKRPSDHEESKVVEKKPDDAKAAEIELPKDSKGTSMPDISDRIKIVHDKSKIESSPTIGPPVPKIVFGGGENTN